MTVPAVTFYKASNNNEKLKLIWSMAKKYFEEGKKVHILVPNEEAAKYVDNLLWRMPEDSFIPHRITNDAAFERITISANTPNLNEIEVIINLCPSICSCKCSMIIELMDETDVAKKGLSMERESKYKGLGYHVCHA